jgi:hypothetical protein
VSGTTKPKNWAKIARRERQRSNLLLAYSVWLGLELPDEWPHNNRTHDDLVMEFMESVDYEDALNKRADS